MEMMTPYSIRAEELKEIYNSINMKYLTQDERLDVLLTLKHTVKVRSPLLSWPLNHRHNLAYRYWHAMVVLFLYLNFLQCRMYSLMYSFNF